MFNFDPVLSTKAAAASTRPFAGYPPYHFVGGNIDAPTVPADALAQAVAKVLHDQGKSMARYGMDSGPQGYMPLRHEICNILGRRAGMQVSPDEVLLTSGSLQAMDLVNTALLDAGDVVVLEAENYAGTLSKLDAMGVTYVPVAQDSGGMRMDALEQVLSDLQAQGRKPKFIYTIPTVQNPTGTVMPLARRHHMLALSRTFDVPIFEDDCYADLVFDGARPPALHALDTRGSVIYCGTFSKTIAPALRVGYLVAPWPLMGHLLPLKTDAGSGALEQMVLAEFLPQHFDDHVAGLLPVLQVKADTLCAALDEHFGTSAEYVRPIGGIYLWVTLPQDVDTRVLFSAALAEGIEINPGPDWAVEKDRNTRRMRLCFANASLEDIRNGIARLADVCHATFGTPPRGQNQTR